jgi:hypothetical protein
MKMSNITDKINNLIATVTQNKELYKYFRVSPEELSHLEYAFDPSTSYRDEPTPELPDDLYPTPYGGVLMIWDIPVFRPSMELMLNRNIGKWHCEYSLTLKKNEHIEYNTYGLHYVLGPMSKKLSLMKDKYFQELAKAILKDPLNRDTRTQYGELLISFGFEEEALENFHFSVEKEAAINWMLNTAEKHNVSFEDLLKAGHLGLQGDYFVQIGSESLRDCFITDAALGKYWAMWSLITGYPNPGLVTNEYSNKPHYIRPFSCSC